MVFSRERQYFYSDTKQISQIIQLPAKNDGKYTSIYTRKKKKQNRQECDGALCTCTDGSYKSLAARKHY
jgi:hypothetical protein